VVDACRRLVGEDHLNAIMESFETHELGRWIIFTSAMCERHGYDVEQTAILILDIMVKVVAQDAKKGVKH